MSCSDRDQSRLDGLPEIIDGRLDEIESRRSDATRVGDNRPRLADNEDGAPNTSVRSDLFIRVPPAGRENGGE